MKRHAYTLLPMLAALLLPAAVSAQSIPNPLASLPFTGGTGTILDIVFSVLQGFLILFGVFAFGFIVVNAFRLIVSRGNEESIKSAKDGIVNALYGFVAALLSYTLVSGVSTILHGTGANELGNANSLNPPINVPDNGFLGAFNVIITGILGLAFVAALLMIVYGGARLILSGGNEDQLASGKTIIKWAVGGVVVILLSYTLLSILNRLFLGNSNF